MVNNRLLISKVAHARQQPKRNAFCYGVYYLCFALDELPLLKNALLSLEKWNLFSFYARDHADGKPMEEWIRGVLREWDIPQADGRIVLLTLPRLFGYVFNPVSFWFCLDKEGKLRAVVSEVHNTFNDRHCYISFHDDRRPINPDDWLRAEKVFHVSPFMDITGYYQFRFVYGEEKIGIWIDYYTADGLMLTTSVAGKRSALTAGSLLRCFFRYPMITLKVISLIHYQALRLWLLKGIRYRPHPNPPVSEVSR